MRAACSRVLARIRPLLAELQGVTTPLPWYYSSRLRPVAPAFVDFHPRALPRIGCILGKTMKIGANSESRQPASDNQPR